MKTLKWLLTRAALITGGHARKQILAISISRLLFFSTAFSLAGVHTGVALEVWTHQWIATNAFLQLGQHPMAQEVTNLDALGSYSQNSPPPEPTASEAEDGMRILEGAVEEDFPWYNPCLLYTSDAADE